MGERIRDKGQGINRPTRTLCVVLLFILYPLSFILSQESPATTPKPGARLQFVPPPMEGTISMGIYDGGGKLVRALHREEEVQSDAFGKALNGLITSWDGKNDAGETMPAGRYFARGFMVGDIGTEGEAMHGNDWVTDDDSPRIFRINGLRIEFESYIVFAQIAGAKQTIRMELDARGYILSTQTFDEAIKEELQKDSVYKHIGRNEPRGGDRLSENPLKSKAGKLRFPLLPANTLLNWLMENPSLMHALSGETQYGWL